MRIRALCVSVLAGLVAIVGVASAGQNAPAPRCFGAASRDALHPCSNPELDQTVTPSPNAALLAQDKRPCTEVSGPAPGPTCWLGTPPAEASRVVALVGDSHADHWRPALYRVASSLHWTIYDVTRSSCPFTTALERSRTFRKPCREYNRGAQRWLAVHPEVSAIIVSGHSSFVVRRKGESSLDAHVRGIIGAWSALPATVRHVLVIRDVPLIEKGLPCVSKALARGQDAGRRCAVPITSAYHRDPAIIAAQRMRSRRVQTIDLTRFFCGPRACFPVVGGALVVGDLYDHLTATFSRTMGPYLLRAIQNAMKTWPAAS